MRALLWIRYQWLRAQLWFLELDAAYAEHKPALFDHFCEERLRVLDQIDAVATELGL